MGENSPVEATYRLQTDNVNQALTASLTPALQSSLIFQPWASHISLTVSFTHHVHHFLPYHIFGSYEEKQSVMPTCLVVFWCQKKKKIPYRTYFSCNQKLQTLTSDLWRWRDYISFLQIKPLNAALLWSWSTINVFFEWNLQIWNS